MLFSSRLREYPESPPKTLVGLVLVSLLFCLQSSTRVATHASGRLPGVAFFLTHGSFRLRVELSQRVCQYFASPPSLFVSDSSYCGSLINTGVLIEMNQRLSNVCFVSSLHVLTGLKSLFLFCRVQFLQSLTQKLIQVRTKAVK